MKKAFVFLWILFFAMEMLVPGQSLAGNSYFATRFSKNTVQPSTKAAGTIQEDLSEPVLVAAAGEPPLKTGADGFMNRFEQGQVSWGFQLGYGFTFNLPPPDAIGDRTDFEFLYIFPLSLIHI